MATPNFTTTPPTYHVTGIGNAIVDVLSYVDDAFLSANGLAKGSMQLVDEAASAALYAKLGASKECSGGSVANTLAGMASLGAKTAFIGKVKNDQLGGIFTHDLRGVGVQFVTPAATNGKATANCLVCVTPDAQRTMMTYLGACNQVSAADIDEALIAASQVFYIEGYLWDLDGAKDAIRAGITAAKKHGRKVALTLSDTFCVHRFREEFLALIKSDVDILFANESEILALTEAADFDAAVAAIQGACEVTAITRSEKGAVIVTKDKVEAVAGEKVSKLLDTTGAGDLFAAGFLYGYTQGYTHAKSAQLGNRCAAEIIQQLGARAEKSLKGLAA